MHLAEAGAADMERLRVHIHAAVVAGAHLLHLDY